MGALVEAPATRRGDVRFPNGDGRFFKRSLLQAVSRFNSPALQNPRMNKPVKALARGRPVVLPHARLMVQKTLQAPAFRQAPLP